jgi:hypothetical protein
MNDQLNKFHSVQKGRQNDRKAYVYKHFVSNGTSTKYIYRTSKILR